MFKKSEEIVVVEVSVELLALVLEKALTLLDLRIGAFFGEVSLLTLAVFEFVVVGFPLLDEDLKAATAISQKETHSYL